MAAKFIAEEGPKKGLVLALEEGDEWTIGRDPEECQLTIEDPSTSRKHLLCRRTPAGITVENLSTTNPILVNEEIIEKPRLLKSGDMLKIGDGLYRFEEEATPQNEKLEDPMEPREDTIFDENAPAGKDALAEINYDLVETGRWLLKVIGGPNTGAEFAMQTGNEYIIGTDPNSCSIVFHDTSVSRQHARVNISNSDILSIEDLKSRNGTLVDGEPLKTKKQIAPNTVVSLGTTSFVIYDREGEMQTIISPLLPSIVKVLQKEEGKKAEDLAAAAQKELRPLPAPPPPPKEKSHAHIGGLVAIAFVTALAAILGIGTYTLFHGQPVVAQQEIDYQKTLADVMLPFPSVKWTFNKSTGRLLLVGHVLSATDKNQLLYNLQGLKFLKSYDDSGVIIDEYVWQEINQLLSNNPQWKGVSVSATSPGHFTVSGYLQTRKQAEQLSQYLSENFRYLDLLEKKIVVDEDVIQQVTNALQNLGIKNLAVQMSNGELTMTGNIPKNKIDQFNTEITAFKKIPGVRLVKNYISELPPEASLINISDKYNVTGYSHSSKNNFTVVINGRILSPGDVLDGMTITSIQPNSVMLEKDGVKYRIDYSK